MLHNLLESCEGSQTAGLTGALSAFFVCSPYRQACEFFFSSAPSTQLNALEFMRLFSTCATGFSCGMPHRAASRRPRAPSAAASAGAGIEKRLYVPFGLPFHRQVDRRCAKRSVASDIAPFSPRTATEVEFARNDGKRCRGDASRRFSRRVVAVAATGPPGGVDLTLLPLVCLV